MVTVTHDERQWIIKPILRNKECPFLFYPNGVWGCEHERRKQYEQDPECNMDKCPIFDSRLEDWAAEPNTEE